MFILEHTKNYTINIVDSREVGVQSLVLLLLVFATFFTSFHTRAPVLFSLVRYRAHLNSCNDGEADDRFPEHVVQTFFLLF